MTEGAQPLYAYLLTEADWDDQILLFLLEVLTGRQMKEVRTRFRKGGIGEAKRLLAPMLATIRRSGVQDHAVFVVAMDNDRAREHRAPDQPDHVTGPHPESKPCRFCALSERVAELLPDGHPIPGAIAVPVQMIEAWLLMIHDANKYPDEAALPSCARRDKPAAQRHYGNDPPMQLKDLWDDECRNAKMTAADLAADCISRLDHTSLAARSPSFRLFRNQVMAWSLK
jgi:hypothetical protein